MAEIQPIQPTLELVPFHGDVIEAVKMPDGQILVSIRRVCESLGVAIQSQLAKLRTSAWARVTIIVTRDQSFAQQELAMIDLESLPMWMATIHPSKIAVSLRPNLVAFQVEAKQALANHFLQAQAPVPNRKALNDPVALRDMLLSYAEEMIALKAVVEEQAPKVKFHDDMAASPDILPLNKIAKILDVGPTLLFEFLRIEKILMSPGTVPYQKYKDAGYFEVIPNHWFDDNGEPHIYTKTFVTGKGMIFLKNYIDSRSKDPDCPPLRSKKDEARRRAEMKGSGYPKSIDGPQIQF